MIIIVIYSGKEMAVVAMANRRAENYGRAIFSALSILRRMAGV
jgi:hypothetical protein